MAILDGDVVSNRISNSFSGGWTWYKGGGDITVFVALSLAMAIFIGQERVILRGEPAYWALVLPAVLFPMLRLRQTFENFLFGAARPLAVFGVLSCGWFAIRHDFVAVAPAVLFVWVAGWATRSEVRLRRDHLFVLTLAFYVVACLAYFSQSDYPDDSWFMAHPKPPPAATVEAAGTPSDGQAATIAVPELRAGTIVVPQQPDTIVAPQQQRDGLDLNAWGVLPGQTAPAYQPWRVSATSNIATSGIFSMIVLMIVLSRIELRPLSGATLISTAYFAILSFVRSVFVGLGLFFASIALMRILPNIPRLRVVAAFSLTAGVTLLVAVSPVLLFYLQDFQFVSRMFLRGQTDLSIADIARQAYRPWLWGEHLKLFWDSPYLMGMGSELGATANTHIINAGQARSDSVSLLTRLLATYGLATIGIFWFLCERCYRHASNNDTWAVAAMAALTFMMMSWGSVFHPTNGIFVLSLLIVAKGSAAFASDRWTG